MINHINGEVICVKGWVVLMVDQIVMVVGAFIVPAIFVLVYDYRIKKHNRKNKK